MSELLEEETRNLVNRIREAYERDSTIGDMTIVRRYSERLHRDQHFVQIYSRQKIPAAWLTDSIYSLDPFYDDVGTSIAVGEKNYLIKQLEKYAETETHTIEAFDLNEIINGIIELRQAGNMHLKLFIPINHYVEFHSAIRNYPPERIDMHYERGREYLSVNRGYSAQVFWSNKFIDLEKVLIFDHGFGSWIVKPGNVSNELSIDVSMEQLDIFHVILYARTEVSYIPTNPEAIKMFKIQREEP